MIYIFSKLKFEQRMIELHLSDKNISEQENIYIISITGKFDSHYFKKEHKNVLNLKFHDITDRDGKYPFTDNLAKLTINFLSKIEKFSNYDLYIHCFKGVSRSAAIAIFSAMYLGEDVKNLLNTYPDIHPNELVLQILNEKIF
jgi:predicted protein tyrosine phosphatase